MIFLHSQEAEATTNAFMGRMLDLESEDQVWVSAIFCSLYDHEYNIFPLWVLTFLIPKMGMKIISLNWDTMLVKELCEFWI